MLNVLNVKVMGYYINELNGKALPALNKAQFLTDNGATLVGWQVDKEDMPELPQLPVAVLMPEFQPNLICVIHNGHFDAAAYAYSREEFEYMARMSETDKRSRLWFTHPDAKEASGYKD